MSISRGQALRELLAEAKRSGITIHADDEAEALLDWAAMREGAPLENYQAVTFGDDIFVRRQYARNVRVLREEMIHVAQQRAGISADEIIRAEAEARFEMIRNRHRWALTNEEIREMVEEIRRVRRSGRY